MRKVWHDDAWEEYLFWQQQDAKTLRRINQLLQSIDRNGTSCIGNPEPLRNNLSGWWSVRINQIDFWYTIRYTIHNIDWRNRYAIRRKHLAAAQNERRCHSLYGIPPNVERLP